MSVARVIYRLNPKEAATFYKKDVIVDELGKKSTYSKNERALTGEMIKEICVPVKVDRLGHITEINGNKV